MAQFRARAPSAGTVDVKRLIYIFVIYYKNVICKTLYRRLYSFQYGTCNVFILEVL